jgi:hypothetical protein
MNPNDKAWAPSPVGPEKTPQRTHDDWLPFRRNT